MASLFPESSMIVKIEWSKEKGLCIPLFCGRAGHSKIGFVHREGFQEILDTSGSGYAQFLCDAASDTIKPFGSDSSFGTKTC